MLKDWETKRQRNEMFMNRLENIKIEKRDIHAQIGKHKDREKRYSQKMWQRKDREKICLLKDWKTLKMKRRIQKKIGKQKKERSENVPQNMVKHKKRKRCS